ncbi:hypothetical protein MRX96_004489 [Rhipicephalus microplus]
MKRLPAEEGERIRAAAMPARELIQQRRSGARLKRHKRATAATAGGAAADFPRSGKARVYPAAAARTRKFRHKKTALRQWETSRGCGNVVVCVADVRAVSRDYRLSLSYPLFPVHSLLVAEPPPTNTRIEESSDGQPKRHETTTYLFKTPSLRFVLMTLAD